MSRSGAVPRARHGFEHWPAPCRSLVLAVIAVTLVGCSPSPEPGASDKISSGAGSTSLADEPVQPLESATGLPTLRVALGRDLFHDTRLSGDQSVSCASCHDLASGGDDGRTVSNGVNGRRGGVNAPTVLNAALNFAQFWDGRAASLEAQIEGPIHNPLEMDTNWTEVLERLSADLDLVARFTAAYQDGLTESNVVNAIVTFERSLITRDSPFDRWLRGDSTAINEQAVTGYQRFKSLGCVSCHQGRNVGGNMFQHFGVMGDYFADRGNVTKADLGRYNVTGREADRHRFKVPSLRNVAQTAPYFHDGSAETLEEAVQTMAQFQLGHRLDEDDVAHLLAFLNSLSAQAKGASR